MVGHRGVAPIEPELHRIRERTIRTAEYRMIGEGRAVDMASLDAGIEPLAQRGRHLVGKIGAVCQGIGVAQAESEREGIVRRRIPAEVEAETRADTGAARHGPLLHRPLEIPHSLRAGQPRIDLAQFLIPQVAQRTAQLLSALDHPAYDMMALAEGCTAAHQRIGQVRDTIDIYNLRYAESVEDRVHQLLGQRLQGIYQLFGQLPDILEDAWVQVALGDIEKAGRTIDAVPRQPVRPVLRPQRQPCLSALGPRSPPLV